MDRLRKKISGENCHGGKGTLSRKKAARNFFRTARGGSGKHPSGCAGGLRLLFIHVHQIVDMFEKI
jgi:hypothetical protein